MKKDFLDFIDKKDQAEINNELAPLKLNIHLWSPELKEETYRNVLHLLAIPRSMHFLECEEVLSYNQ
jgi:hypothetical protein